SGYSRTEKLSGPISVARPPDDALQPDPDARRLGSCRAAHQGGAQPQSDAARARQASRSAAHGGARGAAQRPRAGQEPRRSAHQTAGDVSLRAMRLSGQAVLLALPRMQQMGNLFAQADG